MFQSTHPHGVRQSQIEFYVELTKVSIHAPTRGATHPEFQKNVDDLVSIHAPTRGATVLSRSGIRPMVSFNPRTHTGCDLGNTHKRFGYCVSIHAPTRGATLLTKEVISSKPLFQSTHPHGVRLNNWSWRNRENGVSIHAPTRGATILITIHISQWLAVSIHAPTRCATAFPSVELEWEDGFNPRTHTGCDSVQSYIL